MAAEPPGPLSGGRIPLDAWLPYLMNRLVGRLNQNLGERLRRHGLGFQEWRVLLVLAMQGPRRVGRLVEETEVPQSTLSRLVMRMERDGLVSRAGDPEDARSYVLALSDRGRAAFETVYPEGWAEYRRLADLLSEDEERRLVALLQRLVGEICG